MKKTLFVWMMFWVVYAPAQTGAYRDSLRKLITSRTDDTVKALHYFQYGETYETENGDSALFYYTKGKQLSDKLGYIKGLSTFVSYSVVVLNNQGKFKEALQLCMDLLPELEKGNNKNELAAVYINMGSEWQYLSDLESAAASYLKAGKLAEETGNKKFQRVVNNNLASVFNSLQQYEKGKAYAEKSLLIAREMKDDYAIASSTINIAVALSSLKQNEQSLLLFKEVEKLGNKMSDDIIVMDGWLGIADNLILLKKGSEAEKYYNDVIAKAKFIDAPEYTMYGYMGLSQHLLKTKNYIAAQKVIDEGIVLAEQMGTRLELKDLYARAAELNEAQGNFAAALQWNQKFMILNDSLMNEKKIAGINLLAIKYETEKKEQQLQLQKIKIRQQNTLNYILAASIAALLLVSLLAYRNYQQKRTIHLRKIDELEKEKLLLATQSILKGQEEERSRLAQDLHDGLGGMLSGVKLQLGAMKGNLILSEEHGRVFTNALNKLDESINEMRRVAHNMMPEALMKFGLQQALQDYCDSLSEGQIFTINTEFYGLENRMEPSTEVVIYRIVQELVNNAVKHSGATAILAQVMRQQDILTITVEDNGKGFNAAAVVQGSGLKNVRSRVAYLKGQLDVKSEPGRGTSVHIDCTIASHG